MATIEKRERKGGTVYMVDIRIAGVPRQKKTFQRLTDAKIWAAKTETAIRNGEIKNVVRTAKRKALSDVIERYEREVLPNLAKTTQRAAQTYLGYWKRELGAHALSYITPELIDERMEKLATAPMAAPSQKKRRQGNLPCPETEVPQDAEALPRHAGGAVQPCPYMGLDRQQSAGWRQQDHGHPRPARPLP